MIRSRRWGFAILILAFVPVGVAMLVAGRTLERATVAFLPPGIAVSPAFPFAIAHRNLVLGVALIATFAVMKMCVDAGDRGMRRVAGAVPVLPWLGAWMAVGFVSGISLAFLALYGGALAYMALYRLFSNVGADGPDAADAGVAPSKGW